MINWVIGLFIAAAAAAFLGFGGVASAFADAARIAFFILLVLLVASAVIALSGSRAPAVQNAVRTTSLIAIAAVLSVGAYAWFENDMSAERVGRAIDRQAVAISDSAGAALSDAGARTGTFMERTVADIRSDVRDVADPATDETAKDEATSQH